MMKLAVSRAALRRTGRQQRHGTLRHKVINLEDAVACVQPGDTVGVGGFVAQGAPEALLRALGERFRETKEPSNLTVFFGGGPGDSARRGVSHLGQEGMVRRSIGAHYGQVPEMAKLVLSNKIEAYNLPLGAIGRMLRSQAAKQPGYLTRVGTGTMVDPANGGGKLNEKTKDDLVIPVEIEGERLLLYKSVPINVAFLRGTTADANGNISFEKESLYADNFVLAMAAKNSGGVVIVQVERLAERNTIPARQVHIPGAFVDAVVVAPEPEFSDQSYFTHFNPHWAGQVKAPMEDLEELPLDERKVIARRCAMELRVDDIVNLGIGMPDGVANVASEENILSYITLTTEPGVFGGVGAPHKDFGPASNYEAIVTMSQQFDFYNGGGLDISFLGMAQVNASGDVNVTRFGSKLTGPGGFIDISQCTPTVVFCGTFTAGGLKTEITDDGELRIVKEGRSKKFVKEILETSFCAAEARRQHQRVLYVTERCVFETTPEGLQLVEVAPGISVEKDILPHMEFTPLYDHTKTMDPRIFSKTGRIGLKNMLIGLNMDQRFRYNADSNTLFVDWANVTVQDISQVEQVRAKFEEFFQGLGHKAHFVANYERFDCRKSLVNAWQQMSEELEKKYYLSVMRCVGGTFLRHKLIHGLHIKKDVALEAFREVDAGTGLVSYDDALKVFRRSGRAINDEELFRRAVARVDHRGSGKLSFTDLHEVDLVLQRM